MLGLSTANRWLESLFSGGRSATRLPAVGNDDRPAPHVLTFAQVLNQVWKVYDAKSDEALKNSRKDALAMRRDCFLRALEQERVLPTSRRKWQVKVDNPTDPRQKEVRDGLTRMVQGTRRFQQLRRYLMLATWYGKYGSQGDWRPDPDVKDDQGRVLQTFQRHQPVNGDKIQVQYDGTPAVMINFAMGNWPQESIIFSNQSALLKLDRPDWRQQFVIHQHEVEDADFFDGSMAGRVNGVGLRDYFYWCWYMRSECLSWAMDFMQKVGTLGLLVFWYEQGNKEAMAAAETNAQQASNRTALVMPRVSTKNGQDVGVEQIAPNTGGVEALQNMIAEYFERHMERLAVGQSMSSGADNESGLGGTGRADFAKDTKYQILAADAENLDETLTWEFLNTGKKLNYPWADFPVYFESIVPDPEKAETLKVMLELIDRLPVRKDDLYECGGIREPEEGDETVGGPLVNVLGQPVLGAEGGDVGKPLGGILGGGESTGEPLGGLLAGGRSATPETYAFAQDPPRVDVSNSVVSVLGVMADAIRNQPAPQVHVAAPEVRVEVPAPVVHVAAPNVTVEAPAVQVAAPVVNVAAPNVTVEPPAVTVEAPVVHVAGPDVTVPADAVRVDVAVDSGKPKAVRLERDRTGQLVRAVVEDS